MFKIDGSWLCPWEQRQVLENLTGAGGGLVKWDNARQLPLKSGGKTDVYINIRLARSRPKTLSFLGETFANPVRRLRVDRIVEIPESVSPIAGYLSAITGIPLVTIREETKGGRVTGGKLLGEINCGDRVVIIDDVITDGASKEAALIELRRAGVDVAAMVVLVDRQQGWRKRLAELGFGNVPVWAGMTLHDVRKFLVNEGLMQRCSPELEAKNPIIVALDGQDTWESALRFLDPLRPSGCIIKANDLMLIDNTERILSDLGVYARRIMVDLKFHDISNTVTNFCKRLRANPPWALTVHASGGSEMVRAAVEAMAGTPTIVLAVTVLTSLKDECEVIYRRRPISQVEKLAQLAYQAGARGFVCSTEEAAMIRRMYPEVTIVVPALRSPGKEVQDQKRVGTFAAAKEAGASNFVGGRQFLNHENPAAEVRRVMTEELGIQLS